uniref:Uncharacterized protein n=1 Tax=Panagrolaimus davidi TaxID=227884 RepID=A0A914QTV5_9BILA
MNGSEANRYITKLSLDSRDVTVQYVKDHAPHMFELFKDGPCNSMTYEKSIPFALTLFIHIAVVCLAVQLTIPFIFMFVPASFSVFAIILNVQNVKGRLILN